MPSFADTRRAAGKRQKTMENKDRAAMAKIVESPMAKTFKKIGLSVADSSGEYAGSVKSIDSKKRQALMGR